MGNVLYIKNELLKRIADSVRNVKLINYKFKISDIPEILSKGIIPFNPDATASDDQVFTFITGHESDYDYENEKCIVNYKNMAHAFSNYSFDTSVSKIKYTDNSTKIIIGDQIENMAYSFHNTTGFAGSNVYFTTGKNVVDMNNAYSYSDFTGAPVISKNTIDASSAYSYCNNMLYPYYFGGKENCDVTDLYSGGRAQFRPIGFPGETYPGGYYTVFMDRIPNVEKCHRALLTQEDLRRGTVCYLCNNSNIYNEFMNSALDITNKMYWYDTYNTFYFASDNTPHISLGSFFNCGLRVYDENTGSFSNRRYELKPEYKEMVINGTFLYNYWYDNASGGRIFPIDLENWFYPPEYM